VNAAAGLFAFGTRLLACLPSEHGCWPVCLRNTAAGLFAFGTRLLAYFAFGSRVNAAAGLLPSESRVNAAGNEMHSAAGRCAKY